MPARPCAPPPRQAARIPLWIVALLLFVAVRPAARLLHNVPEARTGMTAGSCAALLPYSRAEQLPLD